MRSIRFCVWDEPVLDTRAGLLDYACSGVR